MSSSMGIWRLCTIILFDRSVASGVHDMRSSEAVTPHRQLVSMEIVCVLCQGADEKTRVREETTDVLLYAYAVPSIDSQFLRQGLTIGADTLAEFGGGKVEFIQVF